MCNETCETIKNFITSYNKPLYAIIPDTFTEYFWEVTTAARASLKRAEKVGCVVRKVDKITPEIYSDIVEIFKSKKIRQGRPQGHLYQVLGADPIDIFKGWHNLDYTIYDCPKHFFDFYGCFLGNKLVAYAELLHSNSLACAYSTMGHANYLKYGIMKYLYLRIIEMNIGNIKYLQYGNSDDKPRMFFLRDLGIIEQDPKVIQDISIQ